jgi:ATP-dependent Clp protease adapter protein ClpS
MALVQYPWFAVNPLLGSPNDHPVSLAMPGSEAQTETEADEEIEESLSEPGEGWRVVLYNDEDHFYEEVIAQVMLATQCSVDVAASVVDRAHHFGQATVTITDKEEAERVAKVLRKIALQVSVEHVG